VKNTQPMCLLALCGGWRICTILEACCTGNRLSLRNKLQGWCNSGNHRKNAKHNDHVFATVYPPPDTIWSTPIAGNLGQPR